MKFRLSSGQFPVVSLDPHAPSCDFLIFPNLVKVHFFLSFLWQILKGSQMHRNLSDWDNKKSEPPQPVKTLLQL